LTTDSILPNEAPVNASVRELFEETCPTLTADDLTFLSGHPVRVPLHAGWHHLVDVFSALIHVPYVTANIRTPTKVEQAGITLSTAHYDSTYTVPTIVDIADGLFLTPTKIGLVKETQRKFKLFYSGYVAQ
jgi:hypothetical protein